MNTPARHLPTAVVSLVLVAIAGCSNAGSSGSSGTTMPGSGSGSTGGGSGSTGSAGGGSGGGPAELPEVHGTVSLNFHGDTKDTSAPLELGGATIVAYVAEGGTLKAIPGVGHDDGTFEVPGVPDGMFLLGVGGSYVYTSARTLDMGFDRAGRADAVWASSGATLTRNFQNLAPWSQGNAVAWFIPNAGVDDVDIAQFAAGSTSAADQIPYSGTGLCDPSKGDVLYVSQMAPSPMGSGTFLSIVRFASFSDYQQADGPTSFAVPLGEVVADRTITVDLHASAFAALGPDVSPAATGLGAYWVLSTAPWVGVDPSGPSNLASLLGSPTVQADTNFGAVAYADPHPTAWSRMRSAQYVWSVPYQVPGSTTATTTLYPKSTVYAPLSTAGAGPIVPAIGPVQSPQVDGQSAFGPLTGISPTPTLSWQPPLLGTATGYEVGVLRLDKTAPPTILRTTGTSVPIPPGVMEQGGAYAFRITAFTSPIDTSVAPYRSGASLATADVVSSLALP